MHRHHKARLELAHDLGRLGRVDGRASADRHQQHVHRRDDLGVGVVERVPEVAEVAHAHVVDLDQVNGVAASLGAFLRVVIRRESDHADAGNLVLTRSFDLVGTLAHRLRVSVVLVVMADGQQVCLLARQAQADGRRVRVGDHCRVLAAQPKASMSEPGDIHIYILSGAETPIKSSAVLKV